LYCIAQRTHRTAFNDSVTLVILLIAHSDDTKTKDHPIEEPSKKDRAGLSF